jgi:uncharacterized protein (TIGR02646 family)
MKHIEKQNEPEALTAFKMKATENWQPTYSGLSKDTKRVIVKALMKEQGDLCCYCEGRITVEGSHIEHFRPQSDPDVDPIDYGNLLRSCQNETQKGEPLHCGKLKDNWFDSNLLVSPLQPDCEKRFAFTGNGIIKPVVEQDKAASETIKRLGLDIRKLKDLRSKAIEPFLDEDLTSEEIHKFVSGYLIKDASGKFGEFYTTIRYLFEDFLTHDQQNHPRPKQAL